MAARARPVRRVRVWIAACLFAIAVAPASDARAGYADTPPSDAGAVLARMAAAMQRWEYEGTLVYLHGHHLTTLRIVHRIDDGESHESLLALSGPIRAVARNGRGVTCVLPDAHPISVEPAHPHSGTLREAPLDAERLAPSYLIHPLGDARIAGRDADVIGIIPRDNLRYGYRFYVDRATGLPLKTDLMDRSSTPIEQVMFTELEVIGEAQPLRSAVASTVEQPESDRPRPNAATNAAANAAETSERWHFARLPRGFRVVGGEQDAKGRRHLMISDGLASVSVYIEPDRGDGLRGATRLGAVHAAGRVIDDHQVTAVGEVPAETIASILSELRPPL